MVLLANASAALQDETCAGPLRDARGTMVASVGVVGPLNMLQPSELAPLVMATAEAVSQYDRTEGWRMAEVGA